MSGLQTPFVVQRVPPERLGRPVGEQTRGTDMLCETEREEEDEDGCANRSETTGPGRTRARSPRSRMG